MSGVTFCVQLARSPIDQQPEPHESIYNFEVDSLPRVIGSWLVRVLQISSSFVTLSLVTRAEGAEEIEGYYY